MDFARFCATCNPFVLRNCLRRLHRVSWSCADHLPVRALSGADSTPFFCAGRTLNQARLRLKRLARSGRRVALQNSILERRCAFRRPRGAAEMCSQAALRVSAATLRCRSPFSSYGARFSGRVALQKCGGIGLNADESRANFFCVIFLLIRDPSEKSKKIRDPSEEIYFFF